MISRWADKKSQVIALRKKGASIRDIEMKLGIPRSTLSGWIKNLELTSRQKERLFRRWEQGLVTARIGAARWHNTQKATRLAEAVESASRTLREIPDDRVSLELALTMLYMGEGSKTKSGLGLGNSDPLIIRFYVSALERLYGISRQNLRAELHLRADQDAEAMKIFWSQAIGVPLSRFLYVTRDQRTSGKPTYDGYPGVCFISGGGVAIQRKIMYLARAYAEKQAH